MTALAFQNPDLLRALADPALTFEGPKALGDHIGRDKSNTARTLKALREDGVIEAGAFALTALGRRILAALDVAEGRATPMMPPLELSEAERLGMQTGAIMPVPRQGLAVWPLDRIVRNPANRKVDADTIPAMADSLAAQGQLQPVTLTPVRDDGNRMLLIGERRWLGALMAREQGRLPDSLAGGLRFEEREATAAEALAITVVENVERQSIPPLELAFLLRDYADAAGTDGKPLDAKSVAVRLGLLSATGGHRDVQDKIRIARNASPEALAAYAVDGSWDRLRDSVTEKKAGAVGEADATGQFNGPGWVNGTPYRHRFNRHEPRHTAADLAPDLQWDDDARPDDPWEPGTFTSWSLPLAANARDHDFPAAQIQIAALQGGGGWVYAAGYNTNEAGHHEALDSVYGRQEAFLDRETAIAAGVDLIRDSLGRMNRNHQLPARIDAWLRTMLSETDRPAPDFVHARTLGWSVHDVHATPFAAEDGDTQPLLQIWIMTDGEGVFRFDRAVSLEEGIQTRKGVRYFGDARQALRHGLEDTRWKLRDRLPVEARLWMDGLLGPLFVNGREYPNEVRANEARRAAGLIPNPSNSGGRSGASPTPADPALPLSEPEARALSARGRMALIEIAHKTAEHPCPVAPNSGAEWSGDADQDFAAFGAAAGKFWLDPAFAELQAQRLARAVMQTDRPPVVALTPEGVAWFAAAELALPVPASAVSDAQEAAGITIAISGTYVSDWLVNEAGPAGLAETITALDAADAGAATDLWDRDPAAIAGDEALLARVRAFAEPDGPAPATFATLEAFGELWRAAGFDPEVVITQAGTGLLANPTDGGEPVEIVTANADGSLPDQRASAIAWLVGWAVEQALKGGVAQ